MFVYTIGDIIGVAVLAVLLVAVALGWIIIRVEKWQIRRRRERKRARRDG